MITPHKIFSVSKQLKNININLSEYITVISLNEISTLVTKYPLSTLILEERHIPRVLNIVRASEAKQFRYICISQNFNSDDRLLLINNNIECITSEKYTQISIDFFRSTQINNNYKVLIVEDDENHKILTEHILQKAGITFHSITKGEEALDAISFFKPDLILLDLYLEGINGDEVVKIIRANKDHTLLPIIIFTSDTSKETRMKVLNAGADDLFTKSIDPDLMVTSLINRMQRNFKPKPMVGSPVKQDTKDPIFYNVKTIVEKEDYLSESLATFLKDNRKNSSASILFLKASNKQFLQKKLGYTGFNILCGLMINKMPEFNQKFNIKQSLAEGVFVFASEDFNQERAIEWVNDLKKWLLLNLFTVNHKEYLFEVVAVVLSNFPSQKIENNLLRKAENTLLEYDYSRKTIILNNESSKIHGFDKIKSQLENSIKTRDFHWHYNQILSTKNERKKIYQLELAIHTESGEELMSDDYLDVANQSGMLRLLDNFTFEHAIRIIRDGELKKIETLVLLEQNLFEYEDKNHRDDLINTIKNLALPKHSLVLQFNLSDAKNHLGILRDVGMQLKTANVLICLSDFTPNEASWEIARKFRTNWIRLKPFDEHHPILKTNETDNLAHIISKSNTLCYEVMISNINTFDLANKLTDLNIDYIQGRFIKSKDSNILLK